MRNFLKIILVISVLCGSCKESSIDIRVENKTAYEIRGVSIYVQSVGYKIEKIAALGNQTLQVPLNAIVLNKHDFHIEASYVNKEGKIISGLDYNDLSGTPRPKYTVTLHEQKVIVR